MNTNHLTLICVVIAMCYFSATYGQQSPASFSFKMENPVGRDAGAARVREALKLRENERLEIVNTETDPYGGTHDRYKVTFKGVRVEHSRVMIHSRGAQVKSINGAYSATAPELDVSPRITERNAVDFAKEAIQAKAYDEGATGHERELVIFNGKLAWKLAVYATAPRGAFTVYIDAHSGAELKRYSRMTDVTTPAETRYSGTKNIETLSTVSGYILKDIMRGNGLHTRMVSQDANGYYDYDAATNLTDVANSWTASKYHNSKKDAMLDVHWGLAVTYDYWFEQHQRKSYDHQNAPVNAYMASVGSKLANASWDGMHLIFGDGLDQDSDPWTSLDVVAHEFGHAVCDHTAELVYEKEPGALNEGLSDIWGICAELYANKKFGLTKNAWVNGEEFIQSGNGILRSFEDPNATGHPDTYRGTNWHSPYDKADHYGVHTNSTVLSHWFYLLARTAGTVNQGVNDFGSAYSVTSIGVEDAEKIVYEAERFYTDELATYDQMRANTLDAAEFIFGANSSQLASVAAAWIAVGVPFTYCKPAANNVSEGWIGSMEVVGQFIQNDNSVTPAGFTDYSGNNNYKIYVTKGKTLTINITPTLVAGPGAQIKWRVWVDEDANGIFDYDTETRYAGSTQGMLSFNYTPISWAKVGFTKMRVQMELPPWSTSQPCGIVSSGEIEDYDVVISPVSCDPPSVFWEQINGPVYYWGYTVTIGWNAKDASEYELQIWRQGSADIYTYLTPNSGVYVSYDVVKTPPGTIWEYQVRSVCPLGNSAWSPVRTISLPCPPAPTLQLGVPSTLLPTKALVLWNSPYYLPDNGYRIAYRPITTPESDWKILDVFNENFAWLEGLKHSTNYEARISYLCEDTPQEWSPVITFTTPCATPENVKAINLGTTTADITWEDQFMEPGTLYTVYYREAGSVTWDNSLQVTGVLQASLSNLKEGTNYQFAVVRLCGNVPSLLPMYPDDFHTYCAKTKDITGDDYYIQQVNMIPSGPGPYTDKTWITLYHSSLLCSLFGPEKLRVNVKASGATAFVIAAIDYDKDGFFSDDEIIVPWTMVVTNQLVTLPSFKICHPDMTEGKTRLRIVASNEALPAYYQLCYMGKSGEAEDYTVEVSPPPAIPVEQGGEGDNAEDGNSLVLFPNPVRNTLQWNCTICDQQSEYVLAIVDHLGSPVYSERGTGNAGALDMSSLERGIYVIRISYDDGTTLTQRLSKE